MVTTLATPQDALDTDYTNAFDAVFIGGVTTDVDTTTWSAQFDVDSTSTCKITVPLPRPSVVEANAVVEIIGGHDGLVGRLFHGRIPSWDLAMTTRGDLLDIRAVGWSSLLAIEDLYDLTFDGPIGIAALFDALCARRGIPSYRADTVTDPTGTIEIMLGGNPNIDDGKVLLPSTQTPLTFLRNACDPFGYRVYDTPDGTVRLSRVSGLPVGTPVVAFEEGLHLVTARRSYDISGIVNYPDINGPTYEDQYGASVPIRGFPETIPSNPLIPVNGGVRKKRTSNSLLVTQQLAEIALAVAQNDGAAPSTPVRWDAVAVPGVSVGDVVTVTSATVEASGELWLTGLDISGGDALTATYDGWAGAGEALPAGDNSTETSIQVDAVHLGDETLSHYAHPAPNVPNDEKTWDITIPERATAVNVRGLHHGTNSQLIGGVNTDIEVSKWEVWLPGADFDDDEQRAEASGNMPIVNEDLALRKDYTNLANWTPFAINLGRLDPGDYTLRLVAGVKAGTDDFEVRDVVLEVFGVAEPVIVPGEDV